MLRLETSEGWRSIPDETPKVPTNTPVDPPAGFYQDDEKDCEALSHGSSELEEKAKEDWESLTEGGHPSAPELGKTYRWVSKDTDEAVEVSFYRSPGPLCFSLRIHEKGATGEKLFATLEETILEFQLTVKNIRKREFIFSAASKGHLAMG